jgi:hypothetical protein
MVVSERLYELVERFDRNHEAYRSRDYSEAQVRVDFINPLLGFLGWDVDNKQGRPEAYRDVIYEDRIKVGGGTKAPDYGFYAGGARRFFLEAKKPSVDLQNDVNPAVQLRRYAWSAKLPLSILTDFEEFAVYDCRFEPEKNDKPTAARLDFLTYDKYPDRWDDIYSVFSREAVLSGSFDKYAESTERKRGAVTVNSAFLREIESWREVLARNIALLNNLSRRQLNYAVQMTIDRIIFLRMAEDRGVEDYGRLLALVNGNGVYERLCHLFRDADDRYNSGLFHFRRERDRDEEPDEFTTSLKIDDAVLKGIIRGLYYPESPYEFSVLPLDVLGQVYEQFLGKVIRLEDGNRAIVEEKPEVRKAGGVYYTPTYIVNYIVKNTVGKLLEGKRPGRRGGASRLRIVDPACGSGSFLIGAYEYLLDWHRDRYLEDGPEKYLKEIYQGPGGQWHLTIDEKRRILLNNIYGVDIDPQAVEVTKLSLLLKVLEGESSDSITRQLALIQERALPDLDNNIKCGNSLIGPEFYDDQELNLFGEEDFYRINVFDWKAAFPSVFNGDKSGFDAVIGNPPYIRIQTLREFAPVEVEHYKRAYRSAGKGNYDIYVTFIERGLELLNKSGRLGYILPHKFFNAKYGQPVRELISSGKHLSEIVHFGDEQVFTGATTYTALLFLDKVGNQHFRFVRADDLTEWRTTRDAEEGTVPVERATPDEWNFVVGPGADLFERLRQMPIKLGDVAHIFVGLQTSADKVYVLEQISEPENGLVSVKDRSDGEWTLELEVLKPFINDVSVFGFERPEARHWLVFPYKLHDGKADLISARKMSLSYPRVWEYLRSQENTLRSRESGKADHEGWYGYIYKKNLTSFEGPKLVVQVISAWGRYAFDDTGVYFTGGGNGPYYGVRWSNLGEQHSLHYLQALLNSPLLDFYLHNISTTFRGGYWSYGKRFIEQLPIRTIDFSDPEDAARHEKMVELVERMLALHEKLAEARMERERTVIGHQISATDKQIDWLVYELYELSEKEIEIIEEKSRIS